MIYRTFLDRTDDFIAEVTADWPLMQVGERVPLAVDGKESLYVITKVGEPQVKDDRLVLDIWVRDYFEQN
jgi:hypothetical protein